jgi:hypothetical protein
MADEVVAGKVGEGRRILQRGLVEEYFPSRVLVMPSVTVALPEPPEGFKEGEKTFREHVEWKDREYKVIGLEREEGKPVFAVFDFSDTGEKGRMYLHKLYLSNLQGVLGADGKPASMQGDLETWLAGRIYMTPQMFDFVGFEDGKGRVDKAVNETLSNRPCRIVSVGDRRQVGVPIFLGINYADGKEPPEEDPLFSYFLEAEELPPEEVAEMIRQGKIKQQ